MGCLALVITFSLPPASLPSAAFLSGACCQGGLSPGPVYAVKAMARLKTLCTGLDGRGVLCLELELCAVSLLGFAELRKRGEAGLW